MQQSLQEQRHRLLLINQVQRKWIEEVLEPSLSQVGQLDLQLLDQPRGSFHSSRDWLVQEAEQTTLSELLILGESGSGKTTLLLDLTRTLLERARRDESQPIPVVFSLSSWVAKPQPLTDWLVEELSTQYHISLWQGQRWIQTDQVLPLLDDLNRVIASREACVKAIKTFRQEHGLVPIVVCCQSADYEDLMQPLHFQRIVKILPLTDGQILQYLERFSQQRESLSRALGLDMKLLELLKLPLMLHLLAVTCQSSSVQIELGENAQDIGAKLRQEIFDRYLERMLNSQRRAFKWSETETKPWLALIARYIQEDEESLFSLERITKYWLPEKPRLWMTMVLLILVAIYALFGGLLMYQVVRPFILASGPCHSYAHAISCINAHMHLLPSASDFSGGPGFGLLFEATTSLGVLVGGSLGYLKYLYSWGGVNLSKAFLRRGKYKRWSRNDWLHRAEDLFGKVLASFSCGFVLALFFVESLTLYIVMGLSIGICLVIFPILVDYLASSLLRFLFWNSNCLPWDIITFLEDCTYHAILYRKNNHYRFVQPLFGDYLASSEKQSKT